jgi:hypothetical protein
MVKVKKLNKVAATLFRATIATNREISLLLLRQTISEWHYLCKLYDYILLFTQNSRKNLKKEKKTRPGNGKVNPAFRATEKNCSGFQSIFLPRQIQRADLSLSTTY